MKKKFRSFRSFAAVLLALLMVSTTFFTIPLTVSAAEATEDNVGAKSGTTGACTWTLDDDGTLTISGNGAMGDYDYYYYYQPPWKFSFLKKAVIEQGVTNIGYLAFYNCSDLESISIPNSVTSISGYAFSSCSKLQSITIPNSVTTIGDYAFESCKKLKSIVIPSSVTSIGDNAFYHIYNPRLNTNCTIYGTEGSYAETYANSHDIPFVALLHSGTTGNCTWALYDDGSLRISGNGQMYNGYDGYHSKAPWVNDVISAIIEPGVTNISCCAFSSCPQLVSVSIPDTVTEIDADAFMHSYNLKSITIPGNVTSIGEGAFYDCLGLESVEIGNGVESIGDYAFEECENLKSITIPESLSSIGEEAFLSCWKLESVELCNSVESIGDYAFADCKLTSITIPASVTSIGESAFKWNSEGFVIKGESDSEAQRYAEANDIPFVALDKIIKSGTTGDCTWALNDEGTLTISGNGAMDNFTLSNSNPAPWKNYEFSEAVIENGVTNIGKNAFSRCTSLTSISIPDSVTTIGDGAFYQCTNLTSIDIPDGVTLIEAQTFDGCTSLTDVIIPDSVTNIKYYAFNNCSNLTSITIPESVTNIEYRAIYECPNVTIYGKKSSAAESFARSNGIPFVELNPAPTSGATGNCTWTLDKNGTLTISGNGAMGNYDQFNPTPWGYDVKKVVINNGVTKIGDWAFAECLQLTDVTIPNSVTQIGYGAFRSCSSLTDVEIPNNVTSIGDYAFCETGLVNVDIPNSVTSIGECAFWVCPELENVNLGNGLTSIGDWAFADCEKLTSIVIPANVTSIGDGAFEGCFDDFVIKGKAGSEAQSYAADEGYRFIALQLGDVNLDGVVDVFDVSDIQKYASYKINLNDIQLSLSDVNGDGSVDILDATKIQKYLVRYIDKLG